ncbi:MAG: XRE family transcriptional regulator [Tannerella sp.]|jgi:transcriptional regulator with XRE-family HTH domain|nr:XRE family transcriptional regulator [Tannerella sp.]
MELKDRIKYFLKESGISQRKFEIAIGKSNGYVNNIVKTISVDVLNSISKAYPELNADWLMTGEGKMLRSEQEEGGTPYLVTKSGTKYYELPNGSYKMVVPFIPVNAYAGYVDEYRDAEFYNKTGEREFNVKEIHHGRYLSFEIKGDSMDDDSKRSISDRDIVLARELGREHWKDGLHIKEYPAWIIVLKNTILCKHIIKQDLDNGTITCHSLNPSPEYCDFELKFDDILQLFNIIKKESDYF